MSLTPRPRRHSDDVTASQPSGDPSTTSASGHFPADHHPAADARPSATRTSSARGAAIALALLVALSGCSLHRSAPPAAAPATSAPEAAFPNAETDDPAAATDAGTDADPSGSSWLVTPPRPMTDHDPRRHLTRPQRIALLDQPAGTGPQIALRFLQALQHRDDLGADRELFILGRSLLADHDETFLSAVMTNVREHAQLDTAGPCTHAEQLDPDSALVACGQRKVVVHVLADADASGVQIAGWLTHHDVYRGPHAHAYTSQEL